MPANGFNVGRDVKIIIKDPLQGTLRFRIKTGWKSEQVVKALESHGLDGNDRFANLPSGWRVNFDLDRADAAVDNYFANSEANYFAGQILGNVYIEEYITNADLSLSQFRYTNLAMRLTNGGDWKGDAITKQAIEGMASRRLRVV